MDAEKVEHLAYHCCLCAGHPVGSARDSLWAERCPASRGRNRGRTPCPYHCAGSTSGLAACFRHHLSFRELCMPETRFPRRSRIGNLGPKKEDTNIITSYEHSIPVWGWSKLW